MSVRPAVAADDPDTAPHQVVHHREQVLRRRHVTQRTQPLRQHRHAHALRADFRFAHLWRLYDRLHQLLAKLRCQLLCQAVREFDVLVGGQAEAQPEFRVVLEQGVGPRGAAAFAIGGPRCDWQVAAIDRRTSGGVGDLQAVAEQLRQKFQSTASRRNLRRRRKTRTAVRGTARRAHWRSRRGRGHSAAGRRRSVRSRVPVRSAAACRTSRSPCRRYS